MARTDDECRPALARAEETTRCPPLLTVPAMVDGAVRRVRSEQHRAAQLLSGGAKYRRLSTLYEQEARLWTLLIRHTAEPVHRRAATDAECSARARAREYAEFAQHWSVTDVSTTAVNP